jgi:ferric-dicitrate binding protein FerR (iron transport regulator)
MSLVDKFRANANDCAFLAEQAGDDESKSAFRRMERAWRALAEEQERLCQKPKKPPK